VGVDAGRRGVQVDLACGEVGIRQGQQDVVRRILSMIEFANTGGGRITGQPTQE
jgi:hypothetical protein